MRSEDSQIFNSKRFIKVCFALFQEFKFKDFNFCGNDKK